MTNTQTDSLDLTFEAYRRARLEGYSITCALLDSALEAGTPLSDAVRDQLTLEPIHIAPWHSSPLAVYACRDGMRIAALEYFWNRTHEIQ